MIEFKIDGLERLQNIANKYPSVSEKHVNRAINRSLVRILGKEKQQAPVHTGNLRDNWGINIGRFQGSLKSNAPYSSAIEFGTRPHFVSAEKLRPWALKKGLNPWAVSKSIAKNGTKANPFMQRTLIDSESGVTAEIKKAIDDTLKELTQ